MLLAAALVALCAPAVAAGDALRGLSLEEAIRHLKSRGLLVIYSSDLVGTDLRVLAEPESREPATMLREILLPHGLDVAVAPDGRLMVVRGETAAAPPIEAPAGPKALREIVVTASRYQFEYQAVPGARELTARQLELLPEIAEDPVRSVARLPGVARQDFSSKPSIRGGIPDETLVRFDGLRLYDPYHLKDFQSLFSTIDPGVVRELTVYTAGFPVAYGDRMSGVVDIAPVRAGGDFGGRVSASLFNVGAMAGGPLDGGRSEWLAAARRGNLDLVLDVVDPDLGSPAYTDAYARFAHRMNDWLSVSGNLLVSEDDLEVFDRDQEEEAVAEYRDEYYWLDFELGSPDRTRARVQLAHGRLSSDRSGVADLPGVGSGSLADRRRFTIDTLVAEGWWSPRPGSRFEAGLEWRATDGRYDYADQAEFELLFLFPGAPQEPTRERQLSVDADGHHYAAYVNWRLQATQALTADLGLRWDKETLSPRGSDDLSPRLGLLWQADARTRLRASWGRFVQAQGIDELAVADGDPDFYPGQHAEHWVASLEHQLVSGLELRIEAYRKQYGDLRPRYENLLNPLVVLPEIKPDRIRIDPVSARADGVEVSLDYQSGPLSGWLGYSWASVTDRITGRDVARSWDQSHYVSAGASYRGDSWDLSLAASWHSGWPTTSVELLTLEPFPLVKTGSWNAARLGTYARIDFRVARHFALGADQRLTLFLDVSNLTNRRNDCCIEYQIETEDPAPYLDVAPVESLPTVPSIGFIWEF